MVLRLIVIAEAKKSDPACKTAQACVDKCQSHGHQTGSCHKNFHRWHLMKRCKCDGEAKSVFKRAEGNLKQFGGNVFGFCQQNPSECFTVGKSLG